jgi:hypothetical protein
MLGFGPISSRSISGSPFRLVSVPLYMAASGSLLSLSGSMDGAYYIVMQASGPLLSLSGSAPGVWLQDMSASGTLLRLGGLPRLLLAGKPFKFKMIAQPYVFRATRSSYDFKMIARPYKFRGYR